MSWVGAPRHRLPPLILHPWADGFPESNFTVSSAPASAVWAGANTAIYIPFRLEEPFTVAKAFVANGATVGTNSWDLGVYEMTNFTTGRLDLIRSTGAVLSSGTANALAETATWKVARTAITAGNNSADATSYATASVTLKAGRLYTLGVVNSHATTAAAVSSIDGGPTFTSRQSINYNGTLRRISLWTAVPTTDYTGTLTITFGATQTGACWALDEMSGVDTTTDDGIVQTATGTGTSVTPLATLSAFASANNATYGLAANSDNNTFTVGSGFTLLGESGHSVPGQRIATEWRVDNDTTVDFTITSNAWGCIGVEVKADASAFVIPPSPNLYLAQACNGTTATFLRLNLGVERGRPAGVLLKTGGFPHASTVTPATMGGSMSMAVAGFSSRSLLA